MWEAVIPKIHSHQVRHQFAAKRLVRTMFRVGDRDD